MGVFIAAAAGCGAAGGVLAIEQLQVVPGTSGGVFSVQWTAEMAFAVIIGGIGTIEGPILGTIVYMVLQQTLQSYNAWYLIVLGIVAIAVALFARRGLWGTVDERFNVRLFPVGYHLWAPGETRRRRRTPVHAASLAASRARPVRLGFCPSRTGPRGKLHA
jgi:branched-chain amino acid transport system permease protein